MKKFVVLSEKSWHKPLFSSLQKKHVNYEWFLIDKKEHFTLETLDRIEPEKIFIPHWSYLIPERIFKKYECIVFHETDLPFGRGGSPIQNLIVRGINETKISALKAGKGLDTGPVYLKKHLNLNGTAKEIFLRSAVVIEEMISEIISHQLIPEPQDGEVVEFKRRKPADSSMDQLDDINKIYDYIRMLDCEGYPPAFIENENFRFQFTRASLLSDKEIAADVRIIKK